MKSTLIYSRPCVMKDKSLYPAMVVNYFIGSLVECEDKRKEVEKQGYNTLIN